MCVYNSCIYIYISYTLRVTRRPSNIEIWVGWVGARGQVMDKLFRSWGSIFDIMLTSFVSHVAVQLGSFGVILGVCWHCNGTKKQGPLEGGFWGGVTKSGYCFLGLLVPLQCYAWGRFC